MRIHEYSSNPKVTERVAEAERELSVYRERDGVFTKASVILNAKQMAPSEWWGLYGNHLPILSGVATKVLSQTVCASAAERNWSIYGRIKSKERAQLGHAKSDKLVYCHTRRSTRRRRRSTPATRRWWRSGTPTRTAPTARTTSSTWPSRARAASCEARGSEGGRGVRVRDTEGEVSGSCIHTIHSSVGG